VKGALFVYILTYGGALVALFNPFVGLLIYTAFSILRPEALWSYGVASGGNYSRIIAIAFLVGWVLNGFGRWDFRSARPTVVAIMAYGAVLVLGLFTAENQPIAEKFVESQFKIILAFVVGITLIDSVAKLKALTWVVGLSESYLGYRFNVYYLQGEILKPQDFTFASFDNNGIAIVAATAAGLMFFLGIGETVQWRRWGAFLAATLLAHIPMFLMSRGGMLALVVVGVVSFLILPKRPGHYFIFAIGVAVALRLAGPAVWERFSSSFEENLDPSAQSRTQLWAAGWQVMLDSPLTGLGPDHWRLHAHKYGFSVGKAMHSTWMSTGTELGFPGLAALLSFYGITMWRLLGLVRRRDLNPALQNTARMVLASLAGFVVSASFVSVEGVDLPYCVVLIGAGTLKLSHLARVASIDSAERRLPRTLHPGWRLGESS
jgi:O-antigen ligase